MNKTIAAIVTGAVLVTILILGVGYYVILYRPGQMQKASSQTGQLGGDTDAFGCKTSAGYQWCEQKKKCLRTFEEPCNTTVSLGEKQLLLTSIKQQLIAEIGPAVRDFPVSTTTIQDGYAKGEIKGPKGSLVWYAKKIDDNWKLILSKERIDCIDLVAYPDYPKTLIPECFNAEENKNIQR